MKIMTRLSHIWDCLCGPKWIELNITYTLTQALKSPPRSLNPLKSKLEPYCFNPKFNYKKSLSPINKYKLLDKKIKQNLGSILSSCLRAAFTLAQSKKVGRLFFDRCLDCLFALSGSACVKAALKHVDEIDPSCCRLRFCLPR